MPWWSKHQCNACFISFDISSILKSSFLFLISLLLYLIYRSIRVASWWVLFSALATSARKCARSSSRRSKTWTRRSDSNTAYVMWTHAIDQCCIDEAIHGIVGIGISAFPDYLYIYIYAIKYPVESCVDWSLWCSDEVRNCGRMEGCGLCTQFVWEFEFTLEVHIPFCWGGLIVRLEFPPNVRRNSKDFAHFCEQIY